MPASASLQLTESQLRASDLLESLYKVHRSGTTSVAGVMTRAMPLLIGPSGSGKTFLVSQFANRHQLPFFSLNVMNWIVRGAKNDQQISLEQIAEFVDSHDEGVVLLDEVNKLKMGHAESSAWTGSVFSELLAFLDRDDRLNAMGFDGILDKLRESFFIVGAGAFQDSWLDSSKGEDERQIGFGQQPAGRGGEREEFYEALVRKEQLVPQELLFRFSDKMVVIAPPMRNEFASRISAIRSGFGLTALGTSELQAVTAQAEESQKMFRYLEGYATECAISLPEDSLSALFRPGLPEEAKAATASAKRITHIVEAEKIRVAAWDEASVAYNRALVQLSASSDALASVIASSSRHWLCSEDSNQKDRFFFELGKFGALLDPEASPKDQIAVPERVLTDLAEWCFEVRPRTASKAERGSLAGKINRAGKNFLEQVFHLHNALFLGEHSRSNSACVARFLNAVRKSQAGHSVLLKMKSATSEVK